MDSRKYHCERSDEFLGVHCTCKAVDCDSVPFKDHYKWNKEGRNLMFVLQEKLEGKEMDIMIMVYSYEKIIKEDTPGTVII